MVDFLAALLTSPDATSALWSLALLAAGEVFRRYVHPKSRIVWASPHEFHFVVPPDESRPNPIIVHTRMIWVQNIGSDVARDIEVHFNFKPQHFEIYPARTYTENRNPDGYFSVATPDLAPREFFTVQLLSGEDLPSVQNVRSHDGAAKAIQMGPLQLYPVWFLRMLQVVFLIGVFAILFVSVRFVTYLIG